MESSIGIKNKGFKNYEDDSEGIETLENKA
jgi:hypothetical protein